MRTTRALVALLALAPAAAAHERWVHHDLIRPFDRTLFESLGWTNGLTTLVVLASGLWLASRSRRSAPAFQVENPAALLGERLVRAARPWCPTLLRIAYGVTLLVVALRGTYLAPDLRAGASVEGQLLIGTAAALGALLILGLRTREAALTSVLVFAWAALRRPFEPFDLTAVSASDVLIYGEVVGIGLYLALLSSGRLAFDSSRPSRASERLRDVALALNRIALGATLVMLGLVKFFVPELFMGVIQNYPEVFHLPFEEFLGVTEEEVVFGASAIEFSLGFYLLLGVHTRVVVAVLGIVFATTAILFEEEVLGHLPLVGMVLVLLVEGGGSLRSVPRAVSAFLHDPTRLPRHSPGFMAGTLVVGFACGATIYGLRPSLAATGPWEAELGPGNGSGVYVGHKNRCTLTIEVVPETFELNEQFSLRITARDADTGELLDGVTLEVDVTMPQHGHGMSVTPRTTSIRKGRFLTEGCRLHMYGAWLIQIQVWRDGRLFDRVSTSYDFRLPAGT